MPYAPGVQSTVGQSLGEGISRGGSRLLEAIGWLTNQAQETKSLRTQLDTIDPGSADEHADMSKGELQGKLVGLHLQDQAKSSALSQALQTAQLSQIQTQQAGETAMSKAMQQTLGSVPTASNTTDLRGQPAAPGNPFTVNFQSRGQITPAALMQAIAANPDAINSPAGRQAMNDFMRASSTAVRGTPEFMTGPDGTTWAFNRSTGQFEPSPLDKIKATAAAKEAMKPQPGTAPLTDPSGKFFWTGNRWMQVQKKPSLFGDDEGGAGPAGGGVNYIWDGNKLVRQAQ